MKQELQKMGIKTIFQVGSWSEDIMHPDTVARVAGNPEKRAKLVKSLMEIQTKYKFDGAILVWLFPGCPSVNSSILVLG